MTPDGLIRLASKILFTPKQYMQIKTCPAKYTLYEIFKCLFKQFLLATDAKKRCFYIIKLLI